MDEIRGLLYAFRRDAIALAVTWVAVCIGVPFVMWLIGDRDARDALWLGAGLLPIGVSFAPMLWLYPSWGGFGRGWRSAAIVLAWAVLSFIPAGAIASLIWRAGGLD